MASYRAPDATAPNTPPEGARSAAALGEGELRRFVVEHGCYEAAENERIFEKWFRTAPRHVFRDADRKYGLTNGRLCDLGCSYGMNLVFSHPESYGVELSDYEANFARSLGLTVFERDFVRDDVSDLPRVDAVWCGAVLEHVESTHGFLRKIHQIIEPGGILALFVPTIPVLAGRALQRLPVIGKYFTGYLASDHINAFTPTTLAFTCERAGFETIDVTPSFPGVLRILNKVPPFPSLIDGSTYIGRAIPNWEYAPKATRQVSNNEAGFDWRRQRS